MTKLFTYIANFVRDGTEASTSRANNGRDAWAEVDLNELREREIERSKARLNSMLR